MFVVFGRPWALALTGPADSPERPVQSTGELRCITHKRTPVPHAGIHQPQLDSFYTPIHHIARCDTMRTGFGVGYGNFCYTPLGGLGIESWGLGMCGMR